MMAGTSACPTRARRTPGPASSAMPTAAISPPAPSSSSATPTWPLPRRRPVRRPLRRLQRLCCAARPRSQPDAPGMLWEAFQWRRSFVLRNPTWLYLRANGRCLRWSIAVTAAGDSSSLLMQWAVEVIPRRLGRPTLVDLPAQMRRRSRPTEGEVTRIIQYVPADANGNILCVRTGRFARVMDQPAVNDIVVLSHGTPASMEVVQARRGGRYEAARGGVRPSSLCEKCEKVASWMVRRAIAWRYPLEWSWRRVLGSPVVQSGPTRSLAVCTVCIEAQHRLSFEKVHGSGSFPYKAQAPPSMLLQECRRKGVFWRKERGTITLCFGGSTRGCV